MARAPVQYDPAVIEFWCRQTAGYTAGLVTSRPAPTPQTSGQSPYGATASGGYGAPPRA
jgi:hypothetical protein